MRATSGLVVVLASLLVASTCVAQESGGGSILFQLNGIGPGVTSSIIGSCTGTTSSYEIECRTTTVIVRRVLEPSRLEAELKTIPNEVKDMLAGGGVAKICSRMSKQSIAANEADAKKKWGDFYERLNPLKRAEMQDFYAMVRTCPNTSGKDIEAWLRKSKIRDTKTCKLFIFLDDAINLKKVAPSKWTGAQGPSGPCDTVILYTLETDDKGLLWKFSWTRNLNPSNGPMCEVVPEHQRADYSYNGPDPLLTCEAVNVK